MKPIVAIVGRTNVGKSTLFNRIIGSRKALTMDLPGVTRDRNYAAAEWNGREFICIDTGGFAGIGGSLDAKVAEQIQLAIAESDIILCVFDGAEGLNVEEKQIVQGLRRVAKPVYYAVNKIDTLAHRERIADFYTLGIEPLFPVSGEHGTGVAELLDAITVPWPAERGSHRSEEGLINVAVVGRPNVGKSSLVNALLARPRLVVDAAPGTTRDVIDSEFHVGTTQFRLLDTAGIRRQSQKGGKLERVTVLRSLRAIERADICLLLLAADEGILKQDANIAGYIEEAGRGLVICWNKMDLTDWRDESGYELRTRRALPFVDYAPICFLSAQVKEGIDMLPAAIEKLHGDLGRRMTTAELGKALSSLSLEHPLPIYQGREVKLSYATQGGTHPPTVIIFTNAPAGIPRSYRRFLTRRLRELFQLRDVPLRLVFRKVR